MDRREALLERLDAIAASLEADADGLALLGLGSVGRELERLDAWSDLDFFAIVRAGAKRRFIDGLSWLERAAPLAYAFKNTADGYKLLFHDGVFAEMAVFEPEELAGIPFAPGRAVWVRPGFDAAALEPKDERGRLRDGFELRHAAEELLTCLYVGLCRWRRGERLSAWRFIQSYCLDRYLELSTLRDPPEGGAADLYGLDRRFELRYPEAAKGLPSFLLGYDRVPEAAAWLLGWLGSWYPVSPALSAEITKLLA